MRPRWPALRSEHPGFFYVAFGILFVHLAVAADHLMVPAANHTPTVWHIYTLVAPIWVWGVWHLLLGVLLALGMYRKFTWARHSLLLSCSTFAATTVATGWSILMTNHSSYLAVVYNLFIAICSLAGAREPEVNPAAGRHDA